MTETIARLKITLDHVEPKVTRRVEVPLGIKLSELHLVIQAAMPWENYHLYEFRAGGQRWGLPEPGLAWADMPRVRAAKGSTLLDLVETTGSKAFAYVYDFGDDWEHRLKIEKTFEPVAGVAYPRLFDASGRCPPEDAGGPWGYAEYLEAMADKRHERHAEMVEWRGPDYDPNVVDVAGIEKELAKLAKRWSRKRASRKAA